MDKGKEKGDDCELTTFHSLNDPNKGHKAIVEYYGELGNLGEFQGGLMESGEWSSNPNSIITSKDEVLKHIIAKRSTTSIQRTDKEDSAACHQCVVQ